MFLLESIGYMNFMIQRYQQLFFLLLGMGLFVFNSCTKQSGHSSTRVVNNGNPAFTDSGNLRLLALGDSYTYGQSVPATDRFVNQTIVRLRADGVAMKYPAEIIAQTGWTTQNLLNAINGASLAGTYDLVTLLIGVNNQFQHRDTAEYRIQFTQCLNKAIAYSGNRANRVFVLSIPDYGATPFGMSNAIQIGMEIDQFNAINKDICVRQGIDYTDITSSSRLASVDPSLVAADGLHPSGLEYAKWAAMLTPKMLPFVK